VEKSVDSLHQPGHLELLLLDDSLEVPGDLGGVDDPVPETLEFLEIFRMRTESDTRIRSSVQPDLLEMSGHGSLSLGGVIRQLTSSQSPNATLAGNLSVMFDLLVPLSC